MVITVMRFPLCYLATIAKHSGLVNIFVQLYCSFKLTKRIINHLILAQILKFFIIFELIENLANLSDRLILPIIYVRTKRLDLFIIRTVYICLSGDLQSSTFNPAIFSLY